ncbi:TolC family outer membrane protein [Sphingomonas sp. CROZ-RG-20F-R02-07]|uniref:TolC family outer membrane protein n=1 Tax=Sphingomonas sp. CROZ-RG-20F-R02-07 TaxID=2914832 RepID=UPI001F5A2223|nr:TolC family outer membrane protein [Sphingomonas sp. CROZ-RG-20F-R02-07]
MARLRSGWLLLAGASLIASPASAETLREALVKAYASNPTITGQRAALRATDEGVPQARSAGLPSVALNTGYVENVLGTSNSLASPARQATGNTQLTVPVYQGGAVRSSVRAAETRVEAGRATLRGTESDLFTAVVASYMDVIRDEAIVGLNMQNVRVLEVNLQASQDRFQVGDLTRTDVAQSQARLALARAQLETAQAQLIGSRETYIRVVGTPPTKLEVPPTLPKLPPSPNAAVGEALNNNPTLLAAAKARDATRYDVNVARASRLPKLSVVVGGNYYNYLGSLGAGTAVPVGQTGTSGTAGVALTVPLFQGGRPASLVRQAEALRSQSIENATSAERAVIAQTRSAYASWKSSEQVIASSETAVNANKLSLEGVRAENSVGTRTILDILNAEQELLNSQVTLVTARRDAYVAGFALLAAMGDAEARDLGLEGGVLYNPVTNYERVRNRFGDFGGDGEPNAQATSTAQTPAQDATVAAPVDPMLESPVDRRAPLTTGAQAPSRRQ